MKATESELKELRRRISRAHTRRRLSKAEIGRLAKVHPSQVGRVVRGDFVTVSANVVQICKVLGLEVELVQRPAGAGDAAWSRLEASVRRLWDKTPQGADRIATLLDTIADLQTG